VVKNKVRNENFTHPMKWVQHAPNMNSRICAQDIIPHEHHNLSHIVCPKGCACIICIWAKGKFFHVIKNLYWGVLKMLFSFCEGQFKVDLFT
jgi:hypothetical protein